MANIVNLGQVFADKITLDEVKRDASVIKNDTSIIKNNISNYVDISTELNIKNSALETIIDINGRGIIKSIIINSLYSLYNKYIIEVDGVIIFDTDMISNFQSTSPESCGIFTEHDTLTYEKYGRYGNTSYTIMINNRENGNCSYINDKSQYTLFKYSPFPIRFNSRFVVKANTSSRNCNIKFSGGII